MAARTAPRSPWPMRILLLLLLVILGFVAYGAWLALATPKPPAQETIEIPVKPNPTPR